MTAVLVLVILTHPLLAPAAPLPALEARARLLAASDARAVDERLRAQLADHPEPRVRAALARALAMTADPSAARWLQTLAGDRQAEVRAATAEAAGRLAGRGPGLADARVVRRLEGLLGRLLGDADPAVRAAAAWSLAGGGFDGAGRLLLGRLVAEKNAEARSAMLAELWRLPDESWLDAARSALGAEEPPVRLAAAWSLARSGKSSALPGLRRALADIDPAVRATALGAAKRGLAAELRDACAAALVDPDESVRTAALEGLIAAAAELPLPEAARSAVQRLALEPAARTHEHAAAAHLAATGALGQEALRAALEATDPLVLRTALASSLKAAGPPPEALERASAWAVDASWPRRAAAAYALAAAGAMAPHDFLADADPRVRTARIEGLGARDTAAARAELRAALANEDAMVRAGAVEALVGFEAPPEEAEMVRLLARERGVAEPDAAVALIDALAAAAGPSAMTRAALVAASGDPRPVVARAAWSALRRYGVRAPQPPVKAETDLGFYRGVLEWASSVRWLEIVTVRGTMQVALDTETAPLTAFRITRLVEDKLYDGLTFHRVVPVFVVQGGDPRGDGWGGPGFSLRDELSLAPYRAGTIGLAHSGPDTAGSQLFVTLSRQPHLDGRYPVVGTVVRGLEVASRLQRGDRILRVRAGEGALPRFYPVWVGEIEPARLAAQIPGWLEERGKAAPDPALLERLASATQRYELLAAVGTWCPDSREQMPRLEAVLAALGERSPFTPPRLIGVDRTKEIDPAAFPFGAVELVPTIVVSFGGVEIGRIAESPASGSIEGDLVRILAPLEGWALEDE